VPGVDPKSATYIFGWKDYSEYNLYRNAKTKDGNSYEITYDYTDKDGIKQTITSTITEGERQLWLGRYDLWNGKTSSARYHFKQAIEWWNKHPDQTSPDKPETLNLLRLTEELTRPYVGGYYVHHDIMSRQELPSFYDLNNNLQKDDGESYIRDLETNRILFYNKDTEQKKDEKSVSFSLPPVQIFNSPFQIGVGCNLSTANQFGTIDSKFKFFPVESEYTPQYLINLKGKEYPLINFGPVDQESAYLDLGVSMFDVMKDWDKAPEWINWARVISPILISKVSFRYGFTHTGMPITSHPEYKYNGYDDLTSKSISDHFDSFRQDISGGVETRTFPLMDWPFAVYLAFGGQYKSSILSKNYPDIYWPFDKNFVAPNYYLENKLSDDDRNMIKADHDEFNRKRGMNNDLTAKESRLYMRANLPGIMQCLRGLSLVDETRVEKGADEPLKISMEYIFTKDDNIRNTDNGFYPSNWNVWAPWTKANTTDPAAKNGDDFHGSIPPFNATGVNFFASYKPRLGHYSGMRSVWEPSDYFSSDGWNSFGKCVSRALWLVPSVASYPLQRLVRLVDPGHERDNETHLYMPLEYNYRQEKYRYTDANGVVSDKKGKNVSFGIGLGINNNFELMYRQSKSDNGNGYTDKIRSVALIFKF
jgi:hypothetical protein